MYPCLLLFDFLLVRRTQRSKRRKSDLGSDLGQGEEDLEWLENLFDDLSKVSE